MLDELVETIDCPVCGSQKFTKILEAKYPNNLTKPELLGIYSSSSDHMLFDQLSECTNCSLVYLNPRVREDIIISSYSEAIDPLFIQQNKQRIKTFKRTLNKLINTYNLSANKSTTILDVGCAGGAFPKAADELGFSVVGVEPSRWLSEQGRLRYGLDIRTGTINDNRFDDNSFDIVTLWDVIEHLTKPDEVMKEIQRILKDSGLLIINYPDYSSFVQRIMKTKWPFLLSVHLIYFTPDTVKRFLNTHGFEVIDIRPFFQTLELNYVLQRASVYFRMFKLFERFANIAGLGQVPFTYNMGQSLLVARKQ